MVVRNDKTVRRDHETGPERRRFARDRAFIAPPTELPEKIVERAAGKRVAPLHLDRLGC